MCKRKPYPRCSYHARIKLEAAEKSGDLERIKLARRNYFTSLAGIADLKAQGKDALAAKYETRRANLIAQAERETNLRKTPLVLALDVDNTSGDFTESIRNHVMKTQGLTPEQAETLLPSPPTHYSFVDSGWFTDVNSFLDAFHSAEENGVYSKMKAFDGVSKTLRTLVSNRDVEVRVVTARGNRWNEETRQWLRRHRIPFTSITHTEDKEKVPGIDVYIDDSDKQINTLQKNGKTVIAFENAYNAAVPSKYRVKKWKEVPAVLKMITQAK